MMPSPQDTPHVVIDLLSMGIENLLDTLSTIEPKPIIWKHDSFHFMARAGVRGHEFETFRFDWQALLSEPADKSNLIEALDHATSHFGLTSTDKLNIVVYGTHGQAYGVLSQPPQSIPKVDDKRIEILLNLLENRGIMTKFYHRLVETGRVKPLWLKSVYPGIICSNAPTSEMIALAKKVRSDVAAKAAGSELLISAAYIYQRTIATGEIDNPTATDWEIWTPDHGSAPKSVTMLIEALKQHQMRPDTKYVLTKLLLENKDRHNPFDTPILRRTALDKLLEVGVDAILWDSDVGILCPTESEAFLPLSVFSL